VKLLALLDDKAQGYRHPTDGIHRTCQNGLVVWNISGFSTLQVKLMSMLFPSLSGRQQGKSSRALCSSVSGQVWRYFKLCIDCCFLKPMTAIINSPDSITLHNEPYHKSAFY
jgi:hypothetical protein